ncbi:MAG: DUF4149 domain-containing protein [Aquificaceae bacterium]
MVKLLLFLNTFYLGLGSFFSLYVAPTLFKVLEKEQAGKVVERVFPVYFGIGLLVVFSSLLMTLRFDKLLALLSLLNLLILAFQEFYVLPISHQLKMVDYQAFMRWHGVSMVLNLISLLMIFISCILLIKK